MKHSKILSVFVIAFVFILSSITPVIAKADCNIFCHLGGAVHTVVTVVVNPVINAVVGVVEAVGGVVTTAAGAVGNAVGINNSLGQVGGSMIQDGENRLTNAVTGVGDISGSHPVSCGVESSPVTLGSPATWYGEGEAAGEMFSFIGSDGSKVITYSAATQNNNGEIKYSYTYNTPGTYSMTINASNLIALRLSDGICNATVVVVPKNSTADQPPVGEFNPISGSVSLNQITTQMANSKTSNFLGFFKNVFDKISSVATTIYSKTYNIAYAGTSLSGVYCAPTAITSNNYTATGIVNGGGGTISVNQSSGICQGADIIFTATPDTNYKVGTWTEISPVSQTPTNYQTYTVGKPEQYEFASVYSDIKVSVTFIPVGNVITSTAGTGGTINPLGTTVVSNNSSQLYIISTTSPNYIISDVTVDGNSVGKITSYNFTNVNTSHTINATFTLVPASQPTPAPTNPGTYYTLTSSVGTGGTIKPAVTPETVPLGSNFTYVITPNSGYNISSILVDGKSVAVNSSYTFSNISASHTISVAFAPIVVAPTTYTITASAGAGGTISPATTASVSSGSSKTYSINPLSGYNISDVLVDGSDKGIISTYTFSNVTANHTISATFVAIPVNNPTQTTQSVTPALVSAPVSTSCRVEGWVCDPDDYSAQLPVVISSGGTTLGTITANQSDWSTDVSCGGFPNHSYVFNIPSGSVFEDGKSHPITATVESVDYSGTSNALNNKVWNSTLTCSPSNTGGISLLLSTSTGQTLVNWSATAGSCSLEKNGAAAIPPISGLQGTVTPTQDDLDNGVNYVLTCLYDGNSTSATLNLYPGLRCTPSQSGNAATDTNIYVNKQMTWSLSATDKKSPVSGASFPFVSNSYNTIYTTIGQKSFPVSAIVGNQSASTQCMTTVKLGVSTSSEI